MGNGNGKLVEGGGLVYVFKFTTYSTALVHTASAPLSPFPSCIPSFILGEWVGFWEGIAGGWGIKGGRYRGGGRGVGEGDLVLIRWIGGKGEIQKKRKREEGGETVERTSCKIGRREQTQWVTLRSKARIDVLEFFYCSRFGKSHESNTKMSEVRESVS